MCRVLLDFCEQWPEGKEGKTTKTRGPIFLSKYVRQKGSRVEDKKAGERLLWDYDFFETQMAAMRGWKPTKSKDEWKKMEMDPTCKVSGPRGQSPAGPRLRIHAWMVGGDKDCHAEIDYEDQSLVDETKAGKMSDQWRQQVAQESRTGFARTDGFAIGSSSDDYYKPKPLSAITSTAEFQPESAMEIMRRINGNSAVISVTTDEEDMATSSGKAASPCKATSKPEQDRDIPGGGDVSSLRNNTKSNCMELVNAETKKLVDESKQAAKVLKGGDVLDEPAYYEDMQSRYNIVLSYLGKKTAELQGTGGKDYASEPVKIHEGVVGQAEATVNTQQLLAMFEALELCPVEDYKTLVCLDEAKIKIQGIKDLKDKKEIESVQEQVRRWCQQLLQLRRSLITSCTDFTRKVKKKKQTKKRPRQRLRPRREQQ